MNLTRVTYSRLANLGNYRNERIELSATFDESEELETVVESLRTRVVDLLGPSEQQLEDRLYTLRKQVGELEKQRTDAWQRYSQAKDFMSAQGLKDMPDFPASFPLLAGQDLEPEQFEVVDDNGPGF